MRPGLLGEARERLAEQARWRECLAHALPAELVARITGVSESDGVLTVFTESAAWCARLRYVMPECEAALRAEAPQLRAVEVKVLPAPAPGAVRMPRK